MRTLEIAFLCRKSKANKNGEAKIEMSLIVDGERVYVALPMRCRPSEYKGNAEVMRYTEAERRRVNEVVAEMTERRMSITATTLKDCYINGCERVYTIEMLFNDCLRLLEMSLEANNYYKYELVRDEFYQFIDKKKSVEEITNAVIKEFYIRMYNKYKQSTAAGKMAKLKYVIKFATDNNKIKINPFGGIKISKPRVNIEYLTDADVNAIYNKVFNSDRLNKVKSLFLFQCGSGLSYADMASLRQEDVQCDGDTYYIIKNRQKTDITFTAVLLPMAVEIWKQYGGQLPTITNQCYNSYLKELQDLCGIKHNLHSHLARKTYCTHLLNQGVRMETVSKCAGHANTKITAAIYAHLQTQTIINEVKSIL